MSGLAIAPATQSEAEEVVALWERAGVTRPWNNPHTDYHLALAAPSSAVLLGREGGALVAAVMVGFDGHRGWVYYLAVEPARRREGHGRAMMEAAEGWLKARGSPKMQLMVRSDNETAFGFYARLGLKRQAVTVLGKRLDNLR